MPTDYEGPLEPSASRILRGASGALTAGETTTPITGIGWANVAVVRLDVTTQTLPDGDDEVDFYIQTSYNEGVDWVDLENFHLATAQNGGTSIREIIIDSNQSNVGAITETDGTLADNTKNTLPLGDRLRISTAVTGATAPTYAYNAEVFLRR